MPGTVRDTHSFAEPEKVRVLHCSLRLDVSFDRRVLRGSATLKLRRADPAADLIVDTRDLQIAEVTAGGDKVPFEIGTADSVLGSSLRIALPRGVDSITINYETSPGASGLQWLKPEQTAGKRHPFLFTQSQSIHARSWIPLQDSPGVRITYDAAITTSCNLPVLMSADSLGVQEEAHMWNMPLPIPPSLIALAIGDLQFAPLGPRTGIYAEPSMLSAAAHEFSDLEQLVLAAEALYGPYQWGRYDLLVLPPSFPFGGMENPKLTFVTPTVIAGDKSLVGLISHELAHSWSGNLVTNATWRDFWLNEGFTTYTENRIQEAVYGREQALMEQVLDRRELENELRKCPLADQILHIDLDGRDPDEGVTRIPYIKGSLLLRQMEHVFGRARLDEFLKGYFRQFAFQSITTDEALRYIRQELLHSDGPNSSGNISLESWVFEPGLPVDAPVPVSPRLESVQRLALEWANGQVLVSELPGLQWNSQEWVEFLQVLPRPMPVTKLRELDERFQLTALSNYEILQEWLLLAIQSDYGAADRALRNFLLTVGRMRFIKPLYSQLMQSEAGRTKAAELYRQARPGYHPIAQTAIDKIVKA